MAARILGYRKLLALVCVCACATAAQLMGVFSESFAAFLGAVYAAYVTGNVGEHWTRSKASFPPLPHLVPRRGAQPDSPPVAAPPAARRASARPRPVSDEPEFDPGEVTETVGVLDRLEAAGISLDEIRDALARGRR